jgi:GR25 family glycosyltransferase involved in LPS biosynthesis
LWNRCVELNEPIIVLEQDSIIENYYSPILDTNGIVKLHTEYWDATDPISGRWTGSTHAYYITPLIARQIIKFVKVHGWMAVDVLFGDKLAPIYHTTPTLVSRQNKFSTTVDLPIF